MMATVIGFGLLAGFILPAQADSAKVPELSGQTDTPTETAEQKAERMKWWNEARFGMFIHWGLYSIPAGEWQDHTYFGEWFLEQTHMPVSQYEKYANQ